MAKFCKNIVMIKFENSEMPIRVQNCTKTSFSYRFTLYSSKPLQLSLKTVYQNFLYTGQNKILLFIYRIFAENVVCSQEAHFLAFVIECVVLCFLYEKEWEKIIPKGPVHFVKFLNQT